MTTQLAILVSDLSLRQYLTAIFSDMDFLLTTIEQTAYEASTLVLTDYFTLRRETSQPSPPVFFIETIFNVTHKSRADDQYTGYIALSEHPKRLLIARIRRWLETLALRETLAERINQEQFLLWTKNDAPQPLSILCVDDDPLASIPLFELCHAIFPTNIRTLRAETLCEAESFVTQEDPVMIFLDVYLSEKEIGYDLFDRLKEPSRCLYFTNYFSAMAAQEEINKGAIDFLPKPISTVTHRNLIHFYADLMCDIWLMKHFHETHHR